MDYTVNRVMADFRVSGAERRELAQALAGILGEEPVYLGAPSFSYKVGAFTVDKDGVLRCLEPSHTGCMDEVLKKLHKLGYDPANSYDSLTVQMPADLFDKNALHRLKQIVYNKAPLFKRAFKTDSLAILRQGEKLLFPWFTLMGNGNEAKAYTDFISAISKMAREQKRVVPQIYAGNNDKYAMRLFLVRLGLKGKEYKETRKILMRYLTGNGAWRDGTPPTRENGEEVNE